jgi:hypothetical protein
MLALIAVVISPVVNGFSQSIPFHTLRNKTIVPARVGDSRVLNIILDTGMSFDGLLVYNPDLADSLHLENPIEVRVPGAGSGEPATGIMADSSEFFLHDVKMNDQRILALTSDIYRGFPSDGVIGYSIFGHYAVELNYDNYEITLHPPSDFPVDETWTALPLYFKRNTIPWIDIAVTIEGGDPVPISVYIDFASGESIELLERKTMKFTLPEKREKAYLGRGLSGDIYGSRAKIQALHIGPYTFTEVEAAFAPAKVRSKQPNADGVLGNDGLRRFNLIFDYAGKQLYIKPNSHFNEKFTRVH